MLRNILLLFPLAPVIINLSCQASNTTNTNTNSNAVIVNQANLPPGFSTSPIQPSGNTTPGIPDPKTVNINVVPSGTATPGIPDSANLKKNLPKGATPTPGIPDPKNIKRQIKTPPFSNTSDIIPPEISPNSNVRRKP